MRLRRGGFSPPLTLLMSAFALLIPPAPVTRHLHRLTERSPTTCNKLQICFFFFFFFPVLCVDTTA
ncbi:hypothetical protein CEW46_32875 [Bacillus cereus]|nr:hypothetical protein CEW46_32875 [Bacillus cereus]